MSRSLAGGFPNLPPTPKPVGGPVPDRTHHPDTSTRHTLDPRCRCGHRKSNHYKGRGICEVVKYDCECARFAEKGE